MRKGMIALRAMYARVRAAFAAKPEPFAKWHLDPEVQRAFIDAHRPVKGRAVPSAFGSTSRGRNWFPRDRAYMPRVVALKKNQQLPKKSPFMLGVILATGRAYLQRHGTLERCDRLAAA
jgi:hypothetical protein